MHAGLVHFMVMEQPCRASDAVAAMYSHPILAWATLALTQLTTGQPCVAKPLHVLHLCEPVEEHKGFDQHLLCGLAQHRAWHRHFMYISLCIYVHGQLTRVRVLVQVL